MFKQYVLVGPEGECLSGNHILPSGMLNGIEVMKSSMSGHEKLGWARRLLWIVLDRDSVNSS